MNEDFESYRIEDEENDQPAKRQTMWSIVPQIMISPASGWAKAAECGPSPEIATLRFLLPLCLVSGASVFLTLLYPRHSGVLNEDGAFTVLLVNAVIQFCSFFLGYYVALVMCKLFLPKDVKQLPTTAFGKLLIMTGTGTLAFFHILFELFPMLDFILVFLPLWTIFLLYKGMERSDMRSDKSILAIGVVCVVTIAGPTLVEWILALFA